MKPSMVLSRMVKTVQVTFTVAILIGIVPLAFGQMYKWVDEKGTVHFTDDLSKIPEKYRAEAESRKVPKETPPPPSPPEAEAKSPSPPMHPEPERFEVNLTPKYGVWLAEVALNERRVLPESPGTGGNETYRKSKYSPPLSKRDVVTLLKSCRIV